MPTIRAATPAWPWGTELQHRPVLLATLLAAIAGWVDALGFYALGGVFTAHLTGNLVLIGDELVHGQPALLPKLLVFPAFFAGVVFAVLVDDQRGMRGRSSVRPLLLFQALAVAGFLFAGLVAGPVAEGAEMSAVGLLAVLLAAVSMGVQNAQGRLALRELGATGVMTNNITQLVLDAVRAVRARGAQVAPAWRRTGRAAAPVFAFSLAAIAAALAYRLLSFWGLVPPLATLVLLALLVD